MEHVAPTAPAKEAPTLGQRFHRMDESRFGLLLILPTAFILFLFLVLPIGYAVLMSFQRVELTVSPDWTFAGLDNYTAILGDRLVRESITRTLVFAVVAVAVTVGLSLIQALVLNEPFRGRSFARVLILLPWAVAPVVIGVMWRFMFHSSYGLVNAILYSLGLIPRYQVWLDNAPLALTIAAIATAWKGMPFITLIILASLQGIPESLYRAAKMDGAGLWARFRWVTLPHLRTTLIFAILLQTIVSLQVFDLIFTLTRGGPGQGTVVLSYLVYVNAFERLSLGRASAMAVLLALLIMGLSALSLSLMMTRRARPTPAAEELLSREAM